MTGKSVDTKNLKKKVKKKPDKRHRKYKPSMGKELVKHMKEGYSFAAFAGRIGVARSALYKWVDRYPEFKAAKIEATEAALFFWERVGIEGLYMGGKDNPFNATVWIFNMKNRFGWRDKQEVDVNVDATVKISYKKDDES